MRGSAVLFLTVISLSTSIQPSAAQSTVREIRARITRAGSGLRDLLFEYRRRDVATPDGVVKSHIDFFRPNGSIAATEIVETRQPETPPPTDGADAAPGGESAQRAAFPEITKSTIRDNQLGIDYEMKRVGNDVLFTATPDSGKPSEERDSWSQDPNNPLISSALFVRLLEDNWPALKAREERRVQVGIHDMKMKVSFILSRDDPATPDAIQPPGSVRVRLRPNSFFIKLVAPPIYFYLNEESGKFMAWRGVVYLKDEIGPNPRDWKPALTETVLVEDRTTAIPEESAQTSGPQTLVPPGAPIASRSRRNP